MIDDSVNLSMENERADAERGQGKHHFPCSADPEQNWQPYPVDPSILCLKVLTIHTVASVLYRGVSVVHRAFSDSDSENITYSIFNIQYSIVVLHTVAQLICADLWYFQFSTTEEYLKFSLRTV